MKNYFGMDGFHGEAKVTLTTNHAYKDNHHSSYMFEYSLVAGLTVFDADVYLLHVTTTLSVVSIACINNFETVVS